MDLAQSGTMATAARSRRQVLAMLIIAAVILVTVATAIFAASLIAASNAGSPSEGVRPFGDTSYDQVESLRGTIALPAGPIDTSYDQVESLRLSGPGR